VSAWVKADRLDHTHRIAVSQSGDQHSGFMLGYDNLHCDRGEPDPGCDPGDGMWAFTIPMNGDGPLRGLTVTAEYPAGWDVGDWVHLTGVLNVPAGEMRMYVNGQSATARRLNTDELATRWNATGGLQVGRAQRNVDPAFNFAGQVACVEVHTGVRTTPEIAAAYFHGCPDVAPEITNTGQFARFASHGFTDYLTTSRLTGPHGYHLVNPLGFAVPEDAVDETRMLYGCAAGQQGRDGFTSADPDCEGQRTLGPIGRAYVDEPPGVPTVPLNRCVITQSGHSAQNKHFDSNNESCSSIGTKEGTLGFLPAYAQLLRYSYPGAHWTSTRGVPSRFELDGWLGVVSLVSGPGRAPLFSCQTAGTGTMTSRDVLCEGSGAPGQVIGYIWTEPPPGMQSRLLYRCKVGDDFFDSSNENCEGQQFDRELGHVVTEL
jgi:hypothetical protein